MKLSSKVAIFSSLVLAAGCAYQDRNAGYAGSQPGYGGQVISSPNTNTIYGQVPQIYTGSTPTSQSDQLLINQVHQALGQSADAAAMRSVNISARNGAVTLTGYAPDDQTRKAVDTIVRNTPGVVSVYDQLQISPAAGMSGPYSGGSSSPGSGSSGAGASTANTRTSADADRTLAYQIQEQLRTDESVSSAAQNINVSAQKGTITLTGSIPNEQDRQRIHDAVRNAPGVISVNDQTQVYTSPTGRTSTPTTATTGDIFNLHVQGLNETDRALAQRILEGLRTDTGLSALLPNVTIHVSQGRVVLQGAVQSQQQKQAIASVVQRAAGSNVVEDEMRIQNPTR
jgi:osmotically-inducible protein OsmY